MLNNKTVAVVVPAYNEETQIGIVIDTMPEFVDRIVIVNDCSKDKTEEIVKRYIDDPKNIDTIEVFPNPTEIQQNFFNRAEIVELEIRKEEEKKFPKHVVYNENKKNRIILINNIENSKAGGAMSVGYKWCRDHSIDCTAVMAGDAQMDPDELEDICSPVVYEDIDYVKGNRLSHKAARRMIPKKRYFGNSVLSALTKIASGYWGISDTQTGYTAISLRALKAINLHEIYRNYGCPNDILVKLNIAKCTLREIAIKPVYAVGEQSKMKIGKVIPTVSWLLLKSFFKRITIKYFIIDFHPIFIFYLIASISGLASIGFLVDIIYGLITYRVTTGTYLGFIALLVTALLTTGFGMWLDIYDNEKLQK